MGNPRRDQYLAELDDRTERMAATHATMMAADKSQRALSKPTR
jgi:hypothetical protein